MLFKLQKSESGRELERSGPHPAGGQQGERRYRSRCRDGTVPARVRSGAARALPARRPWPARVRRGPGSSVCRTASLVRNNAPHSWKKKFPITDMLMLPARLSASSCSSTCSLCFFCYTAMNRNAELACISALV